MGLYGLMTTSISGMSVQSDRMGTVADNIANVNTTGYKEASAEFSTLVAEGHVASYVPGSVSTIARRAITHHMKRAGRVWILVFPDVPISKKPVEVRMGKGKGQPEWWACKVKPGRIMFEVDGVNEETAKEAMRLAAAKLPIATRFVSRIG